MLQFAVYRQSRFQSGNSICRISGILLGRSAGELDEITLTVFFSSKADVSGILVIIDFEYRTILTQETEIEGSLQLKRYRASILQIITLEIPSRYGLRILSYHDSTSLAWFNIVSTSSWPKGMAQYTEESVLLEI